MSGRPRYKVGEMVSALRRARGIKAAAAQLVGCDRDTVANYCKRYPAVQAACDEQRETLIDIAEGKLVQGVDAGEWPAVKFVLTTIGKDRGYVERLEQTGKDGGPIEQRIAHDGRIEVVAVDYRDAARSLLSPPESEHVEAGQAAQLEDHQKP